MTTLTTEDCQKYLQSGILSMPFSPDEFIQEKIQTHCQNQLMQGRFVTELESLLCWLHHNVKYSNDKKFIADNKFQRTAKEIWESKYSTGCTDYALVFATLARQLGFPTTLLHTAEFNWIKNLKSGKECKSHSGHSFCECFYNNRWVLVDPAGDKIVYSYNPNKIELDYTINGNNTFIPYFRGLDLQTKQTIKHHNDIMDEECLKLSI